MVCAGDAYFERFPPLMNRGNPAANNAFNRALNHARNRALNGGRRVYAMEPPNRAVIQEMAGNARRGNEEMIRARINALNQLNEFQNGLDPMPAGLPDFRVNPAPYALLAPPRMGPRNEAVFNEAFAMPNRAHHQAHFQIHNRIHDQALNRGDLERDVGERFQRLINQQFRPAPDGVRYQAREQDPIEQRPGRPAMLAIRRLAQRLKDNMEVKRNDAADVHPREEKDAPKNNHWNLPQPPHDDDDETETEESDSEDDYDKPL